MSHSLYFILYPVLVALAWLVARQSSEHRWVALFVTWMAATDWARIGLRAVLSGRPKPYAGMFRVAFHLDELLVLSWSFLFLALVLRSFTRRSPSFALGGLAATWLLCLQYPLFSGPVLLWVYRLVGISTLVATWICILGAILRRRDLEPGLSHLIIILFAVTDFALYVVPLMGDFAKNWSIANASNVLLLSAACAAHAAWLVSRRRNAMGPA